MTSSNDQLDQMVWLSLRPFWWSRNAFGDKFRRQKYFTETIKGICTSGFEIRAKIEVNEHLSVRLTSQTSLLMSRVTPVGSAFQFGFLPSQHFFLFFFIFFYFFIFYFFIFIFFTTLLSLEIHFSIHVTPWQTHSELGSFPAIGSQTGFSSRKSNGRWSGIQWFHPVVSSPPTSSPRKKLSSIHGSS